METRGCFSGGVMGAEEAARQREWEEAAEAVAYDSCTRPPPIVAVCGPGNSGKSAFSRLLINTLIQRYKKVGYLDIDVGQPEFTPPGFVSLHVLEEQAKDFTMLYLRDPKRCYFFGDVCAKRNPELLLTYIFGLYEYFLKEFYCSNYADYPEKSAIPLVINTSGWVKGTGLHVISEMLKNVSPTHVIRVSTTAEAKNLPSGIFWMNNYEGDAAVNLVEICAAQNPPRHLLVKKEARIIRDLRLMAYFRQCLPRDFPVHCSNDLVQGFASVQPFKLPLSKIQVIDQHNQVSGTYLYHFLNGTIVGIATSAYPLLPVCSTRCCIGLGFVKAIDVSQDYIHLITPLSHKIMEKVNIIFQSYIAVPSCLSRASDKKKSPGAASASFVNVERGVPQPAAGTEPPANIEDFRAAVCSTLPPTHLTTPPWRRQRRVSFNHEPPRCSQRLAKKTRHRTPAMVAAQNVPLKKHGITGNQPPVADDIDQYARAFAEGLTANQVRMIEELFEGYLPEGNAQVVEVAPGPP